MPQPDILIHPSVTMRKYHDGVGELPFHWTADCVRDRLQEMLPDTAVVLGSPAEFEAGAFGAARVLLAGLVTRALLAKLPKLEWLQFTGSGADHFFKACGLWPDDFEGLGVRVLNTPGISRYPVAEHVMAMMLAVARGLPRALAQQARREWTIFQASELRGKAVGIIGLGEIGERVAELSRAFGMHVVACKRDPSTHRGHAHLVLGAEEADAILAQADYVVLVAPLSADTRASFDLARFGRMKRDGVFINVSRGENVVEADLVEALTRGVIRAAAVDTFGPLAVDDAKTMEALSPDSALWALPNMIVMPNNAASSEHYMTYFAEAVADNYRRWRAGRPFRSVVA